MTAIYTPARWSSFDGACRQVPWEEHFHGYEPHDGLRDHSPKWENKTARYFRKFVHAGDIRTNVIL